MAIPCDDVLCYLHEKMAMKCREEETNGRVPYGSNVSSGKNGGYKKMNESIKKNIK